MCPYCRQDAPLVYRGVVPYCTACGQVRAPLTARSVNHAGKTQAVGGTVAHVIGWVIFGIGTALALGLGLLAYALFTVTAALVVFLPIEIVAATIGLLLVKGGQKLHRSGTLEQRGARVRAIMALAQTRGGILTAIDVARATDIGPGDADALLTDLAKTQPELCTLEVDEQGQIFYRFANAPWLTDPRVRVAVEGQANAQARAPAQATASPRVIDAELIDENEEAARPARQAR
jgi:hypothetical protein